MKAKEVFFDDPGAQPPVIELENGNIAHAHCNGARWHMLWWSSDGKHCSEQRCVVNYERERAIAASAPPN